MDSKESIIKAVKAYEWDNADLVIKSIIPNIIFSVGESKSESNALDSRFGGCPVTPKDFSWPLQSKSGNSPLAFFFQLNFEQIKPFDLDNVLPNHGILLCFALVTDDLMWEPEITDGFKIYYFEDTEGLSLAEIPENTPLEQQLNPRTIHYKTSFQLPRYPFNFTLEKLTGDDAHSISNVADTMFDDAYNMSMRMELAKSVGISMPAPKDNFHTLFSHNLILGVPFSVQPFIAEEWSEIYSGDLYEERENYVNLMSFEMKERDGYGFSDDGAHLYLCIHKDDLKNKAFSKTVCIVQNT